MTDTLEFLRRLPLHAWEAGGCFIASRYERRWQFLMATPAILIAALFIVGARLVPPHSSALYESLTIEVQAALNSRDYAKVEFLLSRLRQTGHPSEEMEYQLALAYDLHGEPAEAERLMQALSTRMTRISALALKWRAIKILDRKPDDAALEEAVQLLEAAIQRTPKDAQPYWLLAQVHYRQGQLEQATKHLRLLAPYDYRAGILQVDVCRRLEHLHEAESTARQTLKLLEELPDSEQTLHSQRAHAECLFFLHRDREAIAAFHETLKRYQDDTLRLPLFLTYLRAISQSNTTPEKTNLLKSAIEQFPGSPILLAQLSHVALQQGEQSAEAEQLLKCSLDEGHSSSTMHFVLGTCASQQGDQVDAIQHLRLALAEVEQEEQRILAEPIPAQSAPGNQTVRDMRLKKVDIARCTIQNNLAWTLVHSADPDFKEALEIAEEVCRKFPNVHAFRETRGQVYAHLERWQEAIDDLKFALEGLPKNAEIHASLAQAYQKIGNRANAQLHERRALEMATQPSPAVR